MPATHRAAKGVIRKALFSRGKSRIRKTGAEAFTSAPGSITGSSSYVCSFSGVFTLMRRHLVSFLFLPLGIVLRV